MWDGQHKVGRYLAADVLRDGAWLYQSTSPTQWPRRQPNRNPKLVRVKRAQKGARLTMSDARLRRRQTKVVYPNHQVPPVRRVGVGVQVAHEVPEPTAIG
jgi:hypothetical protein